MATAELGRLRGRWARWRRFKSSPLDSFDGEVAGGGAELPGYSEGLGEAWNGEAARRPELGFAGVREEEKQRERERASQRGREQRRGVLILVQRAAVSILADDGEAAHRAASASTRSCFRS
jgi:hypothetical protein